MKLFVSLWISINNVFISIINLFKALLSSSNGEASMKRFIVLVISFHFMLTSFLVLFGVISYKVDRELLKIILDNDFIIILVGLGVISAGNIAQIVLRKTGTDDIFIKSKNTIINEAAPVPPEDN